MRRSRVIWIGILMVVVGVALLALFGRPLRDSLYAKLTGRRTVSDVLDEYGGPARARTAPAFARAGVSYPPTQVAFLALKDEQQLELWAERGGGWVFVKTYPILAASGGSGPKLQEGDRQVPEGEYHIVALNPNSSLHLSMKLDYPNEFDREHAERDGRTDLGGNIFIHGHESSVGCIAVGDDAIEDLSVLVADIGTENATVLIAPQDPRDQPLPRDVAECPDWLGELYDILEQEFAPFSGG